MNKPSLSDADFEALNTLRFDPEARPKYEALRGVLVWDDEFASGFRGMTTTFPGFMVVMWLHVYRGYLHGFIDKDHLLTAPAGMKFQDLEDLWFDLKDRRHLQWPGFRRLSLSQSDRDFFHQAQDSFLKSFEELISTSPCNTKP